MSGTFTLGQAVVTTDAPQRAGIRNRLLTKLSPQDWVTLQPHLEAVTLRERQVIEVPQKPIAYAYFLEIGVASVVAVDNEDHRIEVGVIGYEGVTGVPLIMGDDRAQHSTTCRFRAAVTVSPLITCAPRWGKAKACAPRC
jgi:hypothetical protein